MEEGIEIMKLSVDLYDRKNRSILGQPVVHSWAELYFLEQVLLTHHFDTIIEIGCWRGGLSLFFGLHALRMGGCAITFDILPEPRGGIYGILKPVVPLEFHQLNSMDSKAKAIIRKYIGYGRSLLYCDGGDKVKDFRVYSPLLKVDDVIMAHDRDNSLAVKKGYSRSISLKDIKRYVEENDLKPFYDNEVNKLGGIFSFIRVEPEDAPAKAKKKS